MFVEDDDDFFSDEDKFPDGLPPKFVEKTDKERYEERAKKPINDYKDPRYDGAMPENPLQAKIFDEMYDEYSGAWDPIPPTKEDLELEEKATSVEWINEWERKVSA